MSTDTRSIKDNSDIVEVVGRYVQLKKQGRTYKGKCPFHDDHRASLDVDPDKQIYKCFACGAGAGDSIDFVMRLGRTFKEAVKEISDPLNISANGFSPEQRPSRPKAKPNSWTQVSPVPAQFADQYPTQHYRLGTPSKMWDYRDASGQLLGFVCRFDLPDGTKEVMPLVFATNGTQMEWRFMGFNKPRPLYGLDLLAQNPNHNVLLVEGEKVADAGHVLLKRVITMTWMGGAEAAHHTDFTPLAGKKVVLFPDNDKPGQKVMHYIASVLIPLGCDVSWVNVPEGYPKGWDLADADWTEENARENLIPWVSAYQPSTDPEPNSQSEPEAYEPEPYESSGPDYPTPPDTYLSGSLELGADHFRFLGHDHHDGSGELYWFVRKRTNKILKYSSGNLSKTALMTLAPLQWWEMNFPGTRGGINLDAAVNFIIQTSQDMKIFTDNYIRGRGAWQDGDDVVINVGDRLYVNGRECELSEKKGKYVYALGEELEIGLRDPLSVAEAKPLMDLLKLIDWERPVNAHLFAGWCVVAPICGVLYWRPHIWLTGSAGTGKSWLLEKVASRLLGKAKIKVQSQTTEAGVRQILGHDSIPVVFDEAEGEDKSAQERIQSVLALMRAASTGDGGEIVKGTTGGNAKKYVIRSCFAFASIAVQVDKQSDRSRVTVLGIKNSRETEADREHRRNNWERILHVYNNNITDEFCHRLQARTISLIPTITRNAETFSNAAAAVLGEQRAGDQLGVLLAGYTSLVSDELISFEAAKRFIEALDWSEERSLEGTRDELQLLSTIMQHITRVEGDSGIRELSISELVTIVRSGYGDHGIGIEQAHNRLKRIGIKYDGDWLYISNTNKYIKQMLDGTPWAKNHNKILQRIEGSRRSDTTRFGPNLSDRAIMIPISVLD